ncbi:MAG: hypothetical protein ACREIA_01885 [Opitutaceae bacterium]
MITRDEEIDVLRRADQPESIDRDSTDHDMARAKAIQLARQGDQVAVVRRARQFVGIRRRHEGMSA